ncbi:MAG: PDZ domain-containing protein, partial [Rubrivivax sp.]
QIVATGRAEHARLGVAVQEVNQTLADSFKLPSPEGALVSSVEKGGPAERAGLQPGDVIRSADGQRIVSSADLPAIVSMAKPGDALKLEVWRKGESTSLSAKLGDAGAKPAATAQAGDVLLSVNGTPVGSVEQVRQMVAKSPKSVALLIQRGDERIFVPVKVG